MAEILDSTLREGEQTPGVNFSVAEKIEIAQWLDRIGVEMIEAGDPSVSPSVYQAVKRIANLKLKAQIVGHSLATRQGIDRAAECGVGRVAVFYPTSKIHLESKTNKTQAQALDIIANHVAYAHSLGLKVRFTPEDASRTEDEFLAEVCNTAISAGADRISFADTLGVMQPARMAERIRGLRSRLQPCAIDLHCHNDYGLAVANAIAGLEAGADCVHTTLNGMGERTGIPDLSVTVMALRDLMGVDHYNIQALTPASQYLEKISGFFLAPNNPITGENAFSHKSGVHTNGILKDPKTYENFDPALLGRERRIIVDKYTGKRAVLNRLEEYGVTPDADQLERIVELIKLTGDERKHLHDADILEIAERVTGLELDVFPKEIHAVTMIEVESHVYTGAVVRRLKAHAQVSNVYEMTGEFDIQAQVHAGNTLLLNNFLEELRAMPGVKNTDTRVILKRHNGVRQAQSNGVEG